MALKAAVKDTTKFLNCITCHAFNADRSQVALCPNNTTVEIYKTNGSDDALKWEKLHTLTEHTGLVSDLDWDPNTNQIVSCSHDRNAYVWRLEGNEWQPTLCVLRINRAAISAKWSPNGTKFAVTSGSKTIPVCYYETSNKWWVSQMIKKHKSTIVNAAWSPNGHLLVTASTDLKCRIVSAFLPKLDDKDSEYDGIFDDKRYVLGEVLAEYDHANAWVNAVAFSPNGKRICFFGQGSTAHFVDLSVDVNAVQTIYSDRFPMLQAQFIDDNTVVAAGFDMNPAIYKCNNGVWEFKGFMQSAASTKTEAKAVSATSLAFARFQQADNTGAQFGSEAKKGAFTTHQGYITSLKLASGTKFTTSGLDGRLQTWDSNTLQ